MARGCKMLRHQLEDPEAVAKDALATRQKAEQQRDADAARLGERIERLTTRGEPGPGSEEPMKTSMA